MPTGILRDSGAVRMFIHMLVIPFVREKSNTGDSGYGVGIVCSIEWGASGSGESVYGSVSCVELSYEVKLVS